MTVRSVHAPRGPRRWLVPALIAALLIAACGTTEETDFVSNPVVTDGDDDGGATATTAAPDPECDDGNPARSLEPEGAVPAPAGFPAGSYMAEIQDRGTLVAGVGADTLKFGFLDPQTGDLEGFDVEIARIVARAIFGVTDVDDRLELRPIQSSQRIPLLNTAVDEGGVDLVVKTMTINCARWGAIDFSAIYFQSGQTLLVSDDSPVGSIDDITDELICAVSGTTSLDELISRGVTVYEAGDWTDCLVEFQQGRIDGISTDNTILAGLAAQDQNAKVIDGTFTEEPYGIGLPKGHPEFTRFVNAVLEQAKADGTWQLHYNEWLAETLGVQPPPQAAYR
jgi:polar amino acid transport system substrate-binding protein